MSRHPYCELRALTPLHPKFNSPIAQISTATEFSLLKVNEPQRIPNQCRNIVIPSHLTSRILTPIQDHHLAP